MICLRGTRSRTCCEPSSVRRSFDGWCGLRNGRPGPGVVNSGLDPRGAAQLTAVNKRRASNGNAQAAEGDSQLETPWRSVKRR